MRALLWTMLLVSVPAFAGMYKWTDESGKTHYGDTIPPQYANQGNTELSKKGLVVKKTEAALTPEQRRAREEDQALKREDDRKKEEQKRRDRALLNTYTTEQEIDLVRDRNLRQAELKLQGAEVRIKQIAPRLEQSRRGALELTQQKKPVPHALQQEIQGLEKEMQHQKEALSQQQQEMAALRAKFEEDKKRFRELQR